MTGVAAAVAQSSDQPKLTRASSAEFGPGASRYTLQDMEEWRAVGLQAQAAFKSHDWPEADRLTFSVCRLRPDAPKGYELRRRVMSRLGCNANEILAMLQEGIGRCQATNKECKELEDATSALQEEVVLADATHVQGAHCDAGQPLVKFTSKVKGVKLLPHEQDLFEAGLMEDVTHPGSSALWLSAVSVEPADASHSVVYRPMGDLEYGHLAEQRALPDTQPYQTIVEGKEGRIYAEKYLRGQKSVDSSPTTVVEFLAPTTLIKELFAKQSKNEDGAISHGLGSKGGRGLPLFNASLQSGETTHRIVFVKRFEKKAVGAFGAGRKKV